jgi:hypothetical protein
MLRCSRNRLYSRRGGQKRTLLDARTRPDGRNRRPRHNLLDGRNRRQRHSLDERTLRRERTRHSHRHERSHRIRRHDRIHRTRRHDRSPLQLLCPG